MNHNHFIQQALKLAKIRQGFTAPNPAVGCVAVKNGKVVAQGYHEGPGKHHAEVQALNTVDNTSGISLYITLEPCCHHGRTPPCTDLIIRKGIKQVYFAYYDPNPQVHGKGQQQLQKAGIQCQCIPSPDVDAFYAHYTHFVQTGLPYVTAKIALSHDNMIAGADSTPVAITGAAAHLFTHTNRRTHSALLTTARTVRNDNPSMNVRLNNTVCKKPLLVLDSQLNLPLSSTVFTSTQPLIILHACQDQKKTLLYEQQGAKLIYLTAKDNQFNIVDVLKIAGQQGYHDLWTETGGQCLHSLLQANAVQRLLVYTSNKIIGRHAYPLSPRTYAIPAQVESFHVLGFDNSSDAYFDWYFI